MLAFIIPVKSKKVTSNWISFSKLLDRTLTSISNQTGKDYVIFLVCHEKPLIQEKKYENLHFIQAKFPAPTLKKTDEDYLLKEHDKGKKLKLGLSFAQKINVDYVMTVDSDDCISNRVVDFVEANKHFKIPGWYFKKGYLMYEGSSWCFLNTNNFNEVCGTVIIIRPDLMALMFEGDYFFDHLRTELDGGYLLSPLPFPGAVYSMLNGNNHVLGNSEMGKRLSFHLFSKTSWQTFFRRLKKYRPVPVSLLKKEFGI